MEEIIKIETISQVHDYLQLPKPSHPLVSVIRPQKHLINVPINKAKFVFNLFQITLKSTFVGTLQYGRNSYDFQEGTMVFTAPNQVITFDGEHEDLSEETGWTILFHPDLIRNSNLGQHIDAYSFFSYESHEALHLSDREKTSLLELVEKLEQEINRSIDKHSQKLIVTNIELLLDYCLRYYDRQFYTRTNLNKDTVSRFEQLLKSYYNTEQQLEQGIPSVKYCGQSLNLSPNYLSDLLKKETGRNAQEHIHLYVIERAKNKLLNSMGSISQIAYDLGFEYPQHFSKIFKSKTGMSPSEYRRLN
jgi:AraC-like DNA-binding protein